MFRKRMFVHVHEQNIVSFYFDTGLAQGFHAATRDDCEN